MGSRLCLLLFPFYVISDLGQKGGGPCTVYSSGQLRRAGRNALNGKRHVALQGRAVL